jgi:hypothetical protein
MALQRYLGHQSHLAWNADGSVKEREEKAKQLPHRGQSNPNPDGEGKKLEMRLSNKRGKRWDAESRRRGDVGLECRGSHPQLLEL